MRMLADFFPEFAEMLDKMDALYADKRTIDEKTYQFVCELNKKFFYDIPFG